MSDLQHIEVLANAACGGGDDNAVDVEFLAMATRWTASGAGLAQVLKTSRPHGPRLLEGARGFAQHDKDQGEMIAKVTALGKELEDAAKATDPVITR